MKDNSVFRMFYLSVYYLFARKLPISYQYGVIGKIAKIFRALLCAQIFELCGENVNVEHGVSFGNGSGVQIGAFSGIGINCQIPNSIIIGKFVMMGPEVMIFAQNHEFSDVLKPMMLQGEKKSLTILIEDDVWIGARAIILPGVRIGKGSIIGAGAVISFDVAPYSICVGNPAKVIRSRMENPKIDD